MQKFTICERKGYANNWQMAVTTIMTVTDKIVVLVSIEYNLGLFQKIKIHPYGEAKLCLQGKYRLSPEGILTTNNCV